MRAACLRTRSARGTSGVTRRRRLDFETHRSGVPGSGLASPWYVARYSWDIEDIEPRVGYRPAEIGFNSGPYQPSVSWYTLS